MTTAVWKNVIYNNNIPIVCAKLYTDLQYTGYTEPTINKGHCSMSTSCDQPTDSCCFGGGGGPCEVHVDGGGDRCAKSIKCKEGETMVYNIRKDSADLYCESPAFRWTQCTSSEEGICATKDIPRTINVGKGYGSCRTSTDKNNCIWESQAKRNKETNGYCSVCYGYDFDNYYWRNVSDLEDWIIDIYTKTNKSLKDGIDTTIKTVLRDQTYIYATTLDFFNQLYNTGYYYTNPEKNNFNDVNFLLSSQNTINFRNDIFDSIDLSTIYTPKERFEKVKKTLSQICVLPNPTLDENNNEYILQFHISYTQYTNIDNKYDSNIAEYGSTIIQNILKDHEAQVIYDTQNQWVPNPPVLDVPKNGTELMAEVIDYNTLNINLVKISEIYNYSGQFSFIPSVTFKLKIKTWSPMLMLYFEILKPNITYNQVTCEIMGNQQEHNFSLPLKCFTTNCEKYPDKCYQEEKTYCKYDLYLPSVFIDVFPYNKIRLSKSTSCRCESNHLAPANKESESKQGKAAAACFDTLCSNDDRAMRNLTGTCKKYCDTVWRWLNTNDPALASQKPDEIDWLRFQQICGKNYRPFYLQKINTEVLIIGIIITLFCIMLTILISISKKYSKNKTILIAIVTLITLGIITTYLSFDLAGQPWCENKKNICESRISKINIPTSFCDFTMPCECEGRDEDCKSDSCICINSLCVPKTGKRPTKTIKVKNKNYSLLVVSIIMCVIMPLIFIYASRDFHWHINRIISIIIVIILSIIPLIYITLKFTIPTKKIVFDGKCK